MNILQNKITAFKTYRVHVNILEARHLEIANVNTIVTVSIGNKNKHVNGKTKNTAYAYFNQLFRFTFFESIEKFLKRRLKIAVYQKRCFKLIGLCDVELVTVWEQPGHQFYHKWAQLIDPRQPFSGVKGYLKCNIQILTEGINEIYPTISNNEIEGNLLMPFQPNRRQHAIYSVIIYRADGITCLKKIFTKEHQIECKSLYVKVNFAGKTLKTAPAKDQQPWNQSLNFIEPIPSLFQTINIELWDQKTGNFIGSSVLSLKSLWLENLPSFGPSFIYLCHSKTSQTTARILMSLNCQVIDRNYPGKIIPIENVIPFDVDNFPPTETYILAFVITQCIFFNKKYFEKCYVTLKHGLETTETSDTILLNNSAAIDESWFLGVCQANTPILQTSSNWPSFDFRERRNNQIKNKAREMLQLIEIYQKSGDSKNNFFPQILENLEILSKHANNKYENNLDKARKQIFNQSLERIKSELKNWKQNNNQVLEMLEKQIHIILEHTNEPQPSFPDFEIILSRQSTTKQTKTLINPDEYLYAENDAETGYHCGKLRTFFITDEKGNDLGVLHGMIWFGLKTHFPKFSNYLEENKLGNSEILHNFHLRVHIYQGRIRPGFDSSGLSDPFVKILAFGQSRETQVKAQTLDPFWDEALLFSKIIVNVKSEFFKTQSIGILFLVLDFDGNSVELIGRGVIHPKIVLSGEDYKPPKLKREPAYNYGEKTAEILMVAELIENFEQEPSESQYKLFAIPDHIRPHFKEYTMEVIFWGVRNLKITSIPPVPTILAIIDCNGIRLESSIARESPSLNFQHHLQKTQIFLPDEEEYIPPLSISLYEFNALNQTSYKGNAILPFLTPFLSTISTNQCPVKLEFEENLKNLIELDEKPDWWTKYYASKLAKRPMRNVTIFPCELEKHYNNFQDFLYTFDIKKGKTSFLNPSIVQETVGYVKCAIRLNPTQTQLGAMPQNHPLDFTIRVYIVSACQLTQTDVNSRCDPYIKLILGKTVYSDRKNYIYKESDPIFGKCFELKGTFPWDHSLQILVMDHDVCLSDDLIGGTTIDLENRYYTKHRGSCGIADTYELSGFCRWRDPFLPTEILERVCRESQMEPPEYLTDVVKIGNCFFDQKQMTKETTALKILKNLQNLPNFGFSLVPEHVETRTLYNPRKPGIEQGKLEMWIDIFPGHFNLPPSVDITPRENQELELRVIVWNTVDVLCEDVSLVTSEKSSDIYVKAWLAVSDASQQTDIHFRSVTGEGNFNWRFIFPFCYSQAERKIITWQRMPFTNELWKEKLPCIFEVQVWDNDIISDDFIGSLNFDLSKMPRGSHSAKRCTLAMLSNDYPQMSLFKIKKTRGWWPFQSTLGGETKLSGKIDMELEIVTAAEAKKFPVGLGRESPQPLTEPIRPGTSFLWALNPLKIFKNLAVGDLGRKLQLFAVIASILTFLIAGWLALPGILLKKLLMEK